MHLPQRKRLYKIAYFSEILKNYFTSHYFEVIDHGNMYLCVKLGKSIVSWKTKLSKFKID
ncbi:hypothetical protein BWI92_09775 [Flectobacillus sp. BAB-3569]|nr:hypothetical protein BWI92_09775 [Flectobacillus sp. BAB-3569]